MAISRIRLLIRRVTSSSILLLLVMLVDWTLMLVSGGMMNVAMVVFGSLNWLRSGSRRLHSGSILIL